MQEARKAEDRIVGSGIKGRAADGFRGARRGNREREKIKPLEAELWTLSNGCKVYYKFTKADGVKVSLMGESKGGKSLLPVEDLPSAEALSSLMMLSGLYKH